MIVVRVKRKREDPVPPNTLLLLVDQPSESLHEKLADSASISAGADVEPRPLKRRPDEVPSYVALQRITTAPSDASSSVAVLDKFTLEAVRKRNRVADFEEEAERQERLSEIENTTFGHSKETSYNPASNDSSAWITHGKRKIAFFDEEELPGSLEGIRRSSSALEASAAAGYGISTATAANKGVVVVDIRRVIGASTVAEGNAPIMRASTIAPTAAPAATTTGQGPTPSSGTLTSSGSCRCSSRCNRQGCQYCAPRTSPGKRILDPASRAMDAAVESAFQSGDFASVFRALEIGANANFQTQRHGITALMAAAFHGDVKVVSMLLNKGADPSISTPLPSAMDGFVVDRCASDFASDPDFFGNHSKAAPSALQNVLFLLRQSPSMYRSASSTSKQINPTNGITTASKPAQKQTSIDDTENDRDYVVDIYCLPSKLRGDADRDVVSQAELSRVHDPEVFSQLAASAATVNITGLKLTRDALTGDLVDVDITDEQFHYDSDWSDLGDDEDPDSNDERYFGNDYPDEDEGDEDMSSSGEQHEVDVGECGVYHDYGSGEEGDDMACESGPRDNKAKYGRSNTAPKKYIPKFLARNGNEAQQSRGPQISLQTGVRFADEPWGVADECDGSGNDSNGSSGQSDSDFVDADAISVDCDADDDGPPTQLSGPGRVGNVMHPFTRDDAMAPVNRTHGALGRLWSGADSAINGRMNEDIESHAPLSSNSLALLSYGTNPSLSSISYRLQEMDERLGFVPYESNANEFDERGLPKYGFDLSDDGTDDLIIRQSYGPSQHNTALVSGPSADMSGYSKVAFDPELDLSD
jgi:hypothetical protein